MGGYHPSAIPTDFIYKNSPFDIIVIGEGETALLNIIKKKGEINKKVIKGHQLDLDKNIILDWNEYGYFELNKKISVYLSRGCPFRCSFCMEHQKCNGSWRSYSVKIAIERIQRIINLFNPSQISIVDACFGFNSKWRKLFLDKIKRRKIRTTIWAETRIDTLDKEDIDLLSDLSFNIEFGIESCSKNTLLIMNKTTYPQKYLKKCKDNIIYLNKKLVPYKLYMIFNHPGETAESYKESIIFIKSLFKNIPKTSGFVGGQNFYFFPGSYIYSNIQYFEKKYGTIVKNKEWWKQKSDHHKLASDIIPSESIRNKYNTYNYWKCDIDEINQLMFEKMPLKLKTFWNNKLKRY